MFILHFFTDFNIKYIYLSSNLFEFNEVLDFQDLSDQYLTEPVVSSKHIWNPIVIGGVSPTLNPILECVAHPPPSITGMEHAFNKEYCKDTL